MLVGGEAGSGKSRLVREFAAEAAARGALVLYGACDAVVRAPYGAVRRGARPPRPRARPGRAARRARPDRRRAGAAAAGSRRSRAPRGRDRPGHRPPPPAHGGHRPAGGRQPRPARAARARGRALGRRADARPAAPPGARGGRARLLLLATFRDTEADVPDALSETLADLRRSEDVVRLRLAGLSGDEVTEFVRARGRRRADGAELARRDQRPDRGQPVPGLRALARARRHGSSIADGALRLSRPLAELGTPGERPRGREPAARAAAAGDERPARAGRRRPARSSSSTSCAPPAGAGEAELLAALDEAVHSGMIEELPSRRLAYRFTHELVRRALYDGLTGVRRAELHLRVGEALEAARARGRGRPRAPLHGRGAARRRRARRRVQRARRAGRGAPRSPSTRRRSGCASRSSSASTTPARARRAAARARDGAAPRRPRGRRARGVRGGGGDRRARRRRAARARRDRLRERVLAPGDHRPGRRRAARAGGRRRSARSPRSCASACSAASPARCRSAASTSAAPPCARRRSRWPGGSATAPRSPRVLVGQLLVARDDPAGARCSRC